MDPLNLKPCPFCNGDAHRVSEHGTCHIACGACGARSDGASSWAGAIALWNRRGEGC